MNLRLLSKQLGIIAMLIGGTMVFSLPFTHRALGRRTVESIVDVAPFEWPAVLVLVVCVSICFALGSLLMWLGRRGDGQLFRKEAMAVVGLSWIMATILGALPFYFCGTYRSPGVRLTDESRVPRVCDFDSRIWERWIVKNELSLPQFAVVRALLQAGAKGLAQGQLASAANTWLQSEEEDSDSPREPFPDDSSKIVDVDAVLRDMAENDEVWRRTLLFPGDPGPNDRIDNYRVRWIHMTFVDCLFESQSGFSTTGATVYSDVEDPVLVPHAILFWRSSTHFLGGLGIIVLFVAILGQGSAGKALMRAEMPGPSKDGSQIRMQHTAWLFAAIYLGLTLLLVVILKLLHLSWFDAMCHAFGTMATGGFSTYNGSVGHFNSVSIEITIIVFMILAGSNFTLLYFLLIFRPATLFSDVEWRTYVLVIASATLLVVAFGVAHGDFTASGDHLSVEDARQPIGRQAATAMRYSLFQVVSIITTTGYGTHDFNEWNSFGRGVLFLLMFVGGCAGSTGGGLKVIRHILFLKILRLEIEQSFHPNVVRPLRLAGKPVDDPELRKNILVYFGLILVIFVFSWMFLVTIEPDATWGGTKEHKLIDSASGIAATLNNIGPGLGTVGATQNYGHFSPLAKVLFIWLMMIGRLEIFVILVLFVPGFWRNR